MVTAARAKDWVTQQTAAFGLRSRALAELVRIERPFGTTMYALLGAYLGTPAERLWSLPVWTAAIVVGLVTAFGFAINDCRDVHVDTLGRPQRPIPSGRISAGSAYAFAWLLAGAALAVSATLGLGAALFTLSATLMSAAYSYRLKDTVLLGNVAIGLLVAAVLVFGAMIAGELTPAVWIAAAMTFPYLVAQEALFNLEDQDEDARAGLRTTATGLGVEPTAALTRGILLVFMAAAVMPWLFGDASGAYLLAAAICLLTPATALLYLLRRPVAQAAVRHAARLSRLIWVTSFLPLGLLK
jgi:geranylgeranylglycerol-phosphate geranylgeranyltransferase